LNRIPCLTCKQHSLEYLSKNPIKLFLGIKDINGEYIGMFKWTWQFHNNINEHLKKKYIDLNTAYLMYNHTSNICTSSCSN